MTIRVAPCCFLALFGCASAAPSHDPVDFIAFDAEIQVSPAFPGAERAEIDGAVADWSFATGGSARFALVPTPSAGPWRIDRATLPYGLGRTHALERLIVIDADAITPPGQPVFAAELRAVVLHELGHAMGLEHGDGDLMDPHVGACIDAVSLAALCSLRPCAEQRPTCPG